MDEDTLARCRGVLGEDHPSTVALAGNLVLLVRCSGLVSQAH
jgi:hypothetical protein